MAITLAPCPRPQGRVVLSDGQVALSLERVRSAGPVFQGARFGDPDRQVAAIAPEQPGAELPPPAGGCLLSRRICHFCRPRPKAAPDLLQASNRTRRSRRLPRAERPRCIGDQVSVTDLQKLIRVLATGQIRRAGQQCLEAAERAPGM